MRVDATLQPSRDQRLVQWLSVMVVLGIWWLSGWSIGSITAISFLLLFGLAFSKYVQQRQARCTGLYQRDDGLWQWQWSDHERWIQGRLQRVIGLPRVVVMVFDCTAIKQQQRVVIWQDQVDRTNWRRLRVVAAWAGQRTSLIEG